MPKKNNTISNEIPLQHFQYELPPIGMNGLWGQSTHPVQRTKKSISGTFPWNHPQSKISFDGISNAFPVEYFRLHTVIHKIRLKTRLVAEYAHIKIIHTSFNGSIKNLFEKILERFSGTFSSDWINIDEIEGRIHFELNLKGSFELSNTAWLGEGSIDRTPTFAFSITAFKKDEFVLPLLNSICNYPPLDDFKLNIMIVDNGGTLSRESLPSDPRILLIQQENLGCTSGFMRALSQVQDIKIDFLIVADDDIVLPPETLYRMMIFQCLANKPLSVGSGMLTIQDPEILWEKGSLVLDKGLNALQPLHKRTKLDKPESSSDIFKETKPDYTALWLMSAPTAQISYLPAFFIYYEDILQGLMLGKKGVRIVVPPHVFLWHATLEKRGAFWKRYLWVRNDLATRFLHPEKMKPGQITLSYIRIMTKLVMSYDYQLAEFHLNAFREGISDASWTMDPLNEKKKVDALIQKTPVQIDLTSFLPLNFKTIDKHKKSFFIRAINRIGYSLTLGNYLNPFSRSRKLDGKLSFRFHGDYEAWGWFGYDTLAVIDKNGTGYVCKRSWGKALAIFTSTLLLCVRFMASYKKMSVAYQNASQEYEKSWREAFRILDESHPNKPQNFPAIQQAGK